MVQVNNIKVNDFKKIGFKTKQEALKLNIRSLPNESEVNYLKRIKKIRIDKRKEELENIRYYKEILKGIEKDIKFDYELENKETIIDKINYCIKENKPVPNNIINNFIDTYFNDYNLLTLHLSDGTTQILTLTNHWVNDIKNFFNDRFLEYVQQYGYKSDTFFNAVYVGIKSISVDHLEEPEKVLKNKNGKLFKYINKTKLDLTRYQVIGENDSIDIIKEHCLLHTFRLCGINEEKINQVKLAFQGGCHISTAKLNDIANIIDKSIILHKYRNTSNKQVESIHGDKNKEKINISIYEDHYFIYEDTIYNNYPIDNYDLVKDFKDMHNICRIDNKNNKLYPRYKETNKINSLTLINLLFKQNLFESKNHKLVEFVQTNDKNLDISLSNIDEDQEIYEYEQKVSQDYKIFFADSECLVNETLHKCFMTGIMKIDDTKPQIYIKSKKYPENHIYQMLQYIINNTLKEDKVIVYFHNLKYDFSVLKHYLNIMGRCIKNGMLYSFKATYSGRKIEFRDSYKLINIPLKDFSKTFNLGDDLTKKEAIGYTYYTEDNIYLDKANIKEYIKHIKKEEICQFYMNLYDNNELFCYEEETFNHMEYYKYYLEYDCKVLCEGLKVYSETIRKITGSNLFDSLTISSLTNSYVAMKGCFDDVYMVKGNLRDYLSKAVYGGRVSCLESERMKVIKKQIVDFDACSLYPSAIYRLCLEYGLPKGKAKQITKEMKNLVELNKIDYYVVTVKITKINKKQQIPFIAMRKDTGILDYVNEVSEDGYICVLDKIALEDYIEYHEIEYDIIDGVYYNEGFNKKFGEVINKLYDDRLKEKAKKNVEGDIMQNIIKLMMNSAYGKTIMKKSKTKEIIVEETRKEAYIYNNFNCIKEIIPLNERQTIINIDSIDDSFNLGIAGLMILSMSKRMMNEVMSVANDNNIKIYYQDTDSMHLEDDQLKDLIKLYEQKYNKILVGKQMCQFHSDFEIKEFNGIVKSKFSVFLGKKCYLDVLQGYDENGNEIKGITKNHIRLKGITEAGINNAINQYGSIETVFEKLSNGEEIEFILNPDNNYKPMFEYNNLNVSTRNEGSFKRLLSFKKNLDEFEEDDELDF